MRISLLVLLSILTLTACGPAREDNVTQVDLEQSAREFLQTGDYSAAAETYLVLVEDDKTNASLYRLKASAAFIEAGNYDRAFEILQNTNISEEESLQVARKEILSARLNLEFGQAAQAVNILQGLPADTIPPNLRYAYHDILARAHYKQAEYMAAIKERLIADEFAGENKEENYRQLWTTLRDIPTDILEENRFNTDQDIASWLELVSIYRTYRFNPDRLDDAIEGWKQRYHDHPAFVSIVPGMREKSAIYVHRPKKIGLLLPFNNQFKKASAAVRDGLLAAWYQDNNKEKSQIVVYDCNALNITETYRQAVNDGVEYIVGPLEKEAVQSLMQMSDLTIPVLALNRLDNVTEWKKDKLIQFGLAPEDEAMQIADIAKQDGYSMALVITPDNNWGRRIAESFQQRWNELGGTVLEQVHFSGERRDFATPVKEVLNIDSSKARIQDVRNTLNLRLNSEERRRQDAEFIFAVAIPADARQLLPQVRFFRAEDLPIYSTSHIFSGIVDSTRDTDMNNVLFVDIPWVIDTRRQLSLIQDNLNNSLNQNNSNYRRLYAMGIDAYHLIPELNRMRLEKNVVFSGETGDLQLSNDNILKRKLLRAQFLDGKPVLIK